jgi:transcriptional regulator with XRE-family HTH domain
MELLHGAEPRMRELEQIGQITNVSPHELLNISLLHEQQIDVFVTNIRFLTKDMGHGMLKNLADTLGVHSTTITNWRRGDVRPRRAHLDALQRYFGLPATTNLEVDPLFLSLSPVSEQDMRVWLHARVAALKSTTMRDLFPALERLLEED